MRGLARGCRRRGAPAGEGRGQDREILDKGRLPELDQAGRRRRCRHAQRRANLPSHPHPFDDVYDGLAGDPSALDSRFLHGAGPRNPGFQKGLPISHKWLGYRPGATARCHLGTHDVLTGFMSGCPIATWTDGTGEKWVGHVGTMVGATNINSRVKTTAGDALDQATEVSGFDPFNAWTPDELAVLGTNARKNMPLYNVGVGVAIMALVTTEGNFFSIALQSMGLNGDVALGCKPVAPMGKDTFLATLA
jgi:hypothetical protein